MLALRQFYRHSLLTPISRSCIRLNSNASEAVIEVLIEKDLPVAIESKAQIATVFGHAPLSTQKERVSAKDIASQLEASLQKTYLSVSHAVLRRKKIRGNHLVVSAEEKRDLDLKHNDSGEVSSVDLDTLYAALNAPVTYTKIEAPEHSLHLTAAYMLSLKSFPKSHPVLTAPPAVIIEHNPLLRDMNRQINAHAISNEPELALECFNSLLLINKPSLVTMNALLLSHVTSSNLSAALSLFSQIHTKYALVPDLRSYTLLTQILADQGRYIQLTRLIQNMSKNALIPSVTIYTNLMRAALVSGKLERAWEIFTHYKREFGKPSAEMYAAAITHCGLTSNPERALELLTELFSANHTLTPDLCVALISCFGKCEGYADDAHQILEMVKNDVSITVNEAMLVALMGACEGKGDINRMRGYWNTLCILRQKLSPSTPPSPAMISCALRVYAKYIRTNYIFVNANDPTVSIDESFTSGSTLGSESIYHIENTTATTHRIILLQLTKIHSYSTSPTTDIQNAMLKALTASNLTFTLAQDLYTTGYSDTSPKNGETFKYMIRMVAKMPALMRMYGNSIWRDFLAWDAEMEVKLDEKDEFTDTVLPESISASVSMSETSDSTVAVDYEAIDPDMCLISKRGAALTHFEKEEVRQQQHRSREQIRDLHIRIANGYQRIGDIDTALSILESAKTFRHQNYLPRIHFNLIQRLLESCVSLAEDHADFSYIRRLFKVCPNEYISPLEEMQQLMNAKEGAKNGKIDGTFGRSWWGWEALGVGKLKRESIMNAFQEKSLKAKRVYKKRESLKVKRIDRSMQ